MIQSGKPRYQRKFRFTAPMHMRQHFVHAHVDKALRSKLKISRTVQISKGDTVKIMSGSKRGTTGKVTNVNLRTGRIAIDSLSRKNAKGKELPRSVHVSTVYITDLNLSDKMRAAKLKVQPVPQQKKEAPKPTAPTAPKAEQKPAPVAAATNVNK